LVLYERRVKGAKVMVGHEDDEFRRGGEEPDVVDGPWKVYVGDPALREIIRDKEINTVPGVEAAAEIVEEATDRQMGLPHKPSLTLGELLGIYEVERGDV
jgi:hypothetical protein